MFSLNELSRKIAEYQRGDIPIDRFSEWFEDNSIGAYAVPELASALAVVESAFSDYHFHGIAEEELKGVLAT